jgi:formylglycine-generating enzyme required for sulfatase activity
MHLGFQEYLAAREIRRRSQNELAILRDLAERFGESWWQEVGLLMLALEDARFDAYMGEVVKQPAFAEFPDLVTACIDDALEVSEGPFVELVEKPPGRDKELWARQLVALKVLEGMGSEAFAELRARLQDHPSPEIRSWLGVQAAKVAAEFLRADRGGYELVLVPGGTFEMGSPEEEEGRWDDESPLHEVTVKGFFLGRYPVTNEEYGRFLAAVKGEEEPAFWGDRQYNQPRQPVVGVSWDDARRYAEWSGLRLPSEAEWEYACRAGTRTRYYSGDTEVDLARVGWYGRNSGGKLHQVGEKEPNRYGLFDMHGNVWEWCEDDWHGDYQGAPEDGSAWVEKPRGADRVGRGGSWSGGARVARAAYRGNDSPGLRGQILGFRLARSIP